MPKDNSENSWLDRRRFIQASLIPAACAIRAGHSTRPVRGEETSHDPGRPTPEIVDTNVHLFQWPYRSLKYDRTGSLVGKLRQHRITLAWAGSFEAVLHKQLDRVNRRVTEECREKGEGLLIPVGSVNPVWPDWQEDLRRCHEQYQVSVIRLYPAYHGYGLEHPEVARLLDATTKRGLLVQVAIRMEDERVHHPSLGAPVVNAAPLPELLSRIPEARVQLLNADTALRGRFVRTLVDQTHTTFDIAGIETQGGVGRLIDGTHTSYPVPVPVERLLFGSHAPFFPCESSLLKLFESPLNLQQLEWLMHANARRLLG
jgi:uncharacterized protein